jgi:SAM-dependent methyltransferase
MLNALFNAVMNRRAAQLMEQVQDWLPRKGPVLDLGSGTGHLSARLQRDLGIDVVTADVSDIRVTGPAPVLIGDGVLPFADRTFSAALLLFMLAYPKDPVEVLAEAARVTDGPLILVQTVYSGRLGHAWHRAREFVWTFIAFHLARLIGYVGRDARFSMNTRRLYTAHTLQSDVAAASLRVRERRARSVLPGGRLVIIGWLLERDD